MDDRPQLERTAAKALLGALLLVVGSTILGGALGLSAAVALTNQRRAT
jgi:ABC-type phosphate transport system permease subunit